MDTPDGAQICAVDSTSIGTMEAPMCASDSAMSGERVRNWINCTADEEKNGGLSKYAFGGTNTVEIGEGSGKGLVYYLKNYRPEGKDQIQGAGVARCRIGEDNVPISERVGTTLWTELEPAWGDIGAVLNAADGYVYAFGHGPKWDEELSARGYVCRVRAEGEAWATVDEYEYFLAGEGEGGKWTRRRQADGAFGTGVLRKEDAVFGWHAMSQSVPFWSVWFGCWMLLHTSNWPESEILCMTAERLEGPWVEMGEVASTKVKVGGEGGEGGFVYCGTAHPEFDASGKTVLVTWTRDNVIWGVTVEWE